MADTEAPEVTEAPVNATGKIPATPEGMMVAYGSLVIMALIPIFLGSFRSIESQREQKENHVSVDRIHCYFGCDGLCLGENWRTTRDHDEERRHDVSNHRILCSLWTLYFLPHIQQGIHQLTALILLPRPRNFRPEPHDVPRHPEAGAQRGPGDSLPSQVHSGKRTGRSLSGRSI